MADPLAKLRDRQLKAIIARLPKSRSCEGCDLCCTAMGVRSLDKPAGVACEHLCGAPGQSCGIYASRPKDCREFYCAWRVAEAIPAKFKPSDCGWVLAVNDPFSHPVIMTVHTDPDRPHAWDTAEARGLFAALADERNCLVVIGQGVLASIIFAPKGYVFTKATAPDLFIDGGLQIGAPDFLFEPSPLPVRNRKTVTNAFKGARWA